MKAKDVMSQPVVSVTPNDTVEKAIRLMLQKRISGLPVVDESNNLVGIVTEGDFLRRAETGTERKRPRWLEFLMGPGRMASEYVHTHARTIEELMTSDPITVQEDASLEDVVTIMEKRRIKRVPVVRGKALVGIVSRANLVHALAAVAAETGSPIVSDEAIHDRLLADLAKERWAPTGALEVIVRDGMVNLWGTITDERERIALKVAAENVPGVKGVVDHLVWVDPTSGMVFYPEEDADREATRQIPAKESGSAAKM